MLFVRNDIILDPKQHFSEQIGLFIFSISFVFGWSGGSVGENTIDDPVAWWKARARYSTITEDGTCRDQASRDRETESMILLIEESIDFRKADQLTEPKP